MRKDRNKKARVDNNQINIKFVRTRLLSARIKLN